jgi:hypothetical protein
VPALVPPVAVRTAALVALAAAGWLVSAVDDSPDANIGLGLLLIGSMLLGVVAWGAADGVRSVRRGRPDREGLLVWLLTAAAVGVLVAVATGTGVAASGDDVPVGPLVSGSLTFAGFVAVPGAVSYGLARTLAEARVNRRG